MGGQGDTGVSSVKAGAHNHINRNRGVLSLHGGRDFQRVFGETYKLTIIGASHLREAPMALTLLKFRQQGQIQSGVQPETTQQRGFINSDIETARTDTNSDNILTQHVST